MGAWAENEKVGDRTLESDVQGAMWAKGPQGRRSSWGRPWGG